MKNIADYLKNKYGKWGWMGQRAHDASGINNILPLDFIVSCDYGTEIPHYFKEEDVFSVEKILGIRKNWSNEDLKSSLNGSMGRQVYKRWDEWGAKTNLLCYRSIKRLEGQADKKVYSSIEKLKKHFDNKILLHKNSKKLGLPGIRGIIATPAKTSFQSLQEKLSVPFVVQFPYGSSGSSTFIIDNEKEYNALGEAYPLKRAVIREYLKGFSLNVNAVIVSTPDGAKTFPSIPSVQITGLPECSNSPSMYCGNDYALVNDIDPDIIKQVSAQVRIVGDWMSAAGFRGIFGMDFIVKKGRVHTMEINPRFQNSTSLYTVLSAIDRPKENALFLLHIAEFLQKEDKEMRAFVKKFPTRDLMLPVSGSQVILHNGEKDTIVTGELQGGVYALKGEGLVFKRNGVTVEDCTDKGDVLVTCGIPETYTRVEANAPICKVQTKRNMLEPGSRRTLTQEGNLVVSSFYKLLALKDLDKVDAARS